MTTTPAQESWLRTYHVLSAQADAFHDSQSVAFGLLAAYDQIESKNRIEVHQLLSDWLNSDDNKLRYDATFLASQRRIRELVPAVKIAIERTENQTGPEARYELKKLMRILAELTE